MLISTFPCDNKNACITKKYKRTVNTTCSLHALCLANSAQTITENLELFTYNAIIEIISVFIVQLNGIGIGLTVNEGSLQQ